MATTTVLTLAVSLGVLYGVTRLAGQTFTVVMLGVVISMIASMAFRDNRPLQRTATAGAMMAIAGAAVAVGALLAPHRVAGDVVFVAIMTVATAGRRFGPRATILGMVAFMSYFFALLLGATVSMLPWLIIALAIGTTVSLAMSFLLAAHPDRQLRSMLRSLESRLELVLDAIGDAIASGRWDERHRRRLRSRVTQVNEAMLMVDTHLSDFDVRGAGIGVDGDTLRVRLFDIELATETTARAWRRAAAGNGTRPPDELVEALDALRAGLRHDAPLDRLAQAESLAETARRATAIPAPYRGVALATAALSRAVQRARDTAVDAAEGAASQAEEDADAFATDDRSSDAPATRAPATGSADQDDTGMAAGSWLDRLSPSTRQAIQVALASSLAIVAGEELSSARWYWAVIAAFVIYSGTSSRGETVTKGRQRVIGTIVGVAIGAVIASFVGGDVAVSIVLIFVALFIGFYLMQVSYAFMVIATSTMLALLYGLLGEFSLSLLLTRIEETAIGAAIGIATAVLVLPTRTGNTVQAQLCSYLRDLGELVGRIGKPPARSEDELTRAARDLDQQLATLRASAKPLTSTIIRRSFAGSVSHLLGVLDACQHYARALARLARPVSDPVAQAALERATGHVKDNLDRLATVIEGHPPDRPQSAEDTLDAAQAAVEAHTPDRLPDQRNLSLIVRYLRQIDLSVVRLHDELTAA